MDYCQKVLWHEGMFLVPHHFQQWDRANDVNLRQIAKTLQPLGYGLSALAIDQEALANQSFGLLSGAGIMPDGLVFSVPESDDLPAARTIGQLFSPHKERLAVYLAAPIQRPGTVSCSESGLNDGRGTRYRSKTVTVQDESLGGSQRDIVTAAKNLRILFEGEPLDDHTWIKVAELAHAPTGGVVVADGYIPPCLHLGASPVLLSMLRRLLEIVMARAKEMAAQRRQRTQGLVEFSVSEIANFLMLHTVNGYLPALVHYYHKPKVHPELLFLELSRLAGQLYTFASTGNASELPRYDHDNLIATFSALDEKVRSMLETNIPTRYVPIPLTQASERIYAARIPETVVEEARFYLSVMSSLPAERVMREIPLKAKVASSGRLGALIAQAMRGMGLTYLSVPPAEIPTQQGYSYFEVQRSGDEWEAVKKTRTISMYLPPEFTDLKMEFLAVKD